VGHFEVATGGILWVAIREKFKKGFSTKLFSALPVESPVCLANSSEYGSAFSGWGVQ